MITFAAAAGTRFPRPKGRPRNPNTTTLKQQISNMIKKILMTVLLLAPTTLFAQKVAHFNFNDVIQAYPEFQTAQKDLETMGQKFQKDLTDMEKEIQTKFDKYQKEVNDSTPANIRQRREQELMDLRDRYTQAQQDNQQAFQQAQQQKLQPIYVKIGDAVNAVAKEGGYVLVVDRTSATGPALYLNETLSTDVTKQVMAKLGISATAAAATK